MIVNIIFWKKLSLFSRNISFYIKKITAIILKLSLLSVLILVFKEHSFRSVAAHESLSESINNRFIMKYTNFYQFDNYHTRFIFNIYTVCSQLGLGPFECMTTNGRNRTKWKCHTFVNAKVFIHAWISVFCK